MDEKEQALHLLLERSPRLLTDLAEVAAAAAVLGRSLPASRGTRGACLALSALLQSLGPQVRAKLVQIKYSGGKVT